ncbi:MAG: hypothetical protein Q8J89_05995 [Caulobacter sp.]|nr:hypothetical protein [Caulobacter sp.]
MSAFVSSPERLNAADIAAVLDRFGGQDLLARGAVNIFSLAAIRERAGERWPRRRPDVWAYTERKLAEHLTFQDLSQRVGETDYLVAMTSEDGMAAQAMTLKVLEEVLLHFLGAAEQGDLRVRAVTGLSGGEVSCAPLDPRAILKARKVAPSPAAAEPAPDIDPAEEKRRNPHMFATGSGLTLRIDFAVEPVISLRHGVAAAVRIEPTVTETVSGRVIPTRAFARLFDSDLATIDLATLHYAGLYLPRVDAPAARPLIVPVSFRTMAANKGRQALIAAAGEAQGRMKRGLLIELVDVDRGTPQGRLIEVCGLLRTLCRGVFARVQSGRDEMASLREARVAGVTLDAAEFAGDDARLAAAMLDLGRQARGQTPLIAVQGLASQVMFAVAETAGLTHASLRTAPATLATAAA